MAGGTGENQHFVASDAMKSLAYLAAAGNGSSMHSDIRTTLNIYGDVVTNEMAEASSKVAGLAFKTC
jgi:hypothetical protein